MVLDKLEFLFSEAGIALRRNVLMTFAAITTVAVSLFLLGGLGYIYWRVLGYANTLPDRFEMQVFLRMDADYETVKETARKIRTIPGVKAAVWIPKEKRWALDRKEKPELTEGLENPYPEAFKVTLSDLSLSDYVAGEVKELRAVDPEGVVYLQQEQRMVSDALKLIRGLGVGLGGLLFLTGGVLIYNAIRLTVMSRRLEIRIMQLVGATKLTVQVPFLIEGMVQGTIGGIVATFGLMAAHWGVSSFISSFQALGTPPAFPTSVFFWLLAIAGAVYGLICSTLALRAPLRYR
jgi:cell division transport system permease protein